MAEPSRPSDDPAGGRKLVEVGESSYPPGFRAARGRNWIMLGLTYASYYLCRYNLDPIAPDIIRDLNLSKESFGLFKTGRDGAYAIGQMVNGLYTDRVGGKQAMIIGAVATILLNLAFGFVAWSTLAWIFPILLVIRTLDGYFQAFGAPGFIKVNTAWFRRKERGAFAGIFGAMINLGRVGANQFAVLLATGFSITILAWSLKVESLNWRYMFIIPPIVVAVVVVAMNLLVRNTPEEAGYIVPHHDEPDHGTADNERVKLSDVFRRIASNKVVWIIAAAYLCTGFVRGATDAWWAVYLKETWHADRTTTLFSVVAWGLPIVATFGSLASGYISDRLFAGRRAPVATALYFFQSLLTIAAMLLPQTGPLASEYIAAALLLTIATLCNSTHSILGTAAAMDLGGRKMAGCASGIIDSFQYYGSMLAGWGIGRMFVSFRPEGMDAKAAPLIPFYWFGSMLPFGILGTCLMGYVWLRNRGKNTLGA